MTRRCPACIQELPVEEFYRRRRREGYSVYCKRCTSEQTVTRQRSLKVRALEYKGACCRLCGYDRYAGALEFHHRDPKEKDFSLSHVGKTEFESIKSELDKCDLLCANCHREEHAKHKTRPWKPREFPDGTPEKTCPSCSKNLPLEAFYKRRTQAGASPYCKNCTYEVALKRQRHRKQQAIDYKGSSCKACGYGRYVGALEFHHRDPAEKDFSLSAMRLVNFEKVRAELDKCDLLCANCHREEHARIKGQF